MMGSLENYYISTISQEGVEKKKNDTKSGCLKNMRSYCREYCEHTGIHGFKYFGEKRSIIEKICWMLIFISSLVVCIGVIYKTYIKWQTSPVIVNIATEEQQIYNIPFPAVTICHEVKVSKSYFDYSKNLKLLVQGQQLKSENLKKLQYMSLLCGEGKVHIDKIPKINFTDEEFFNFLEKGTADFFKKCTWMGEVYPCYEIFQPMVTDEGLCMTFNVLNREELFTEKVAYPPINYNRHFYRGHSSVQWESDHGYGESAGVEAFPRRALLAGSTNALIVNINISMGDLDYACTSFQGFQVVLHKAIRYPTVQQHYFRVPLKKSVIVAISPMQIFTSKNVKAYGVEKRKCFFQSEKKLKYFKYYTQHNCRLECTADLSMKKCGCVAFYMPRQNNTPICGNANIACLKRAKNYFEMSGLQRSINRDNNIERFNDKMECDCSPMCNAVEYNTEITEIDYDWYKEYEAVTSETLNDEKFSSSQLVIYFKSNHFIPYERNELYGHLDFLANVGGLLGLFVGFSLLSFFEIFYFLSIRIICNLHLYKRWYGIGGKLNN